MPRPVALTIAGSDPSGGAGIQADLKTFHQFGVYGEAAITLITAQNSMEVTRVEFLAADLVAQQIRSVLTDIPPQAAKTGALGNREIIEIVAAAAATFNFPLVVDPVILTKHGAALLTPDAIDALKTLLLPRATLITPNLEEAAMLTRMEISHVASMKRAAQILSEMGPKAVLVKGGHLAGDAIDILFYEGEWMQFSAVRIDTRHTHGTGCTYSAAITASLAAGHDLPTAVGRAKQYVTEAIRGNPGLGSGSGPVNHHAEVPRG